MKKILLLIVALVVIAGGYLFMHLDSAARNIIEEAGTKALGVPVHVGGVTVSLASRTATISGVTVDNPKGYTTPYLLKTKSISVTLGDVSTSLVTVKEVLVDGMSVNYELGAAGPNLDAVQNNMRTGGDKSAPASSTSKPEIVITELKIVGTEVNAAAGALQKEIKVPTITVNNIGSKSNPATPVQVASEVMTKIISSTSAAVMKGGFGAPVDTLQKGLKGFLGH